MEEGRGRWCGWTTGMEEDVENEVREAAVEGGDGLKRDGAGGV